MDRWVGKLAVVTGASSGIGLAIGKTLIREGMIVVGLARRKELMEKEMSEAIKAGKFYARECDVSSEKSVNEAFDYIADTFKVVNLLVNNAGVVTTKSIEDSTVEELQEVIGVNLMGVLYCYKAAVTLMKTANEAHIININSIAGQKVPSPTWTRGDYTSVNVYPATKFAVRAISEVLSYELIGRNIRVTNLSPGYVRTAICTKAALSTMPALKPEDVADSIVYVIGSPANVQITELTIKPLGETFSQSNMDRWNGKVAVITGASSGIGLATAKSLIKHGVIVIGLARRKLQMEENMKNAKGPGKFYARECDITDEESVISALNWVMDTLGALNILVNNAGIVTSGKIEDTSSSDIENVFNVNVIGLLYCSKHAIKLMKANENEAQIVNINSVLGHAVLSPRSGFANVYPATKFAVRALSETLKNELIDAKIRVSNVSPGLVKTEIYDRAASQNSIIQKMPTLNAEDVADSIVHVLSAPPHVEITEIMIQPKGSAF
ncbi:short-chain dehydrogenase reductase 2a-like [Nasonia vitripennis]|uniref:Uncharacterized protein n=2 Tax=Nasonia vitripennis TaxID=7425 RepID=A0A7M7QPM6_NASVI|nr:short-chain dehydrogenase reductase 2a-like [Nasonia vitripennis]